MVTLHRGHIHLQRPSSQGTHNASPEPLRDFCRMNRIHPHIEFRQIINNSFMSVVSMASHPYNNQTTLRFVLPDRSWLNSPLATLSAPISCLMGPPLKLKLPNGEEEITSRFLIFLTIGGRVDVSTVNKRRHNHLPLQTHFVIPPYWKPPTRLGFGCGALISLQPIILALSCPNFIDTSFSCNAYHHSLIQPNSM